MQTRNRSGHGIEMRHALRVRRALTLGLFGLSTTALGGACSSSHGAHLAEKGPETRTVASPHTFKVLQNRAGTTSRLDFAPLEVTNAAMSAAQASGAKAAPGLSKDDFRLRLQDQVTITPAPGTSSVPVVVNGAQNLVAAAATECGMVGDSFSVISTDPILSSDPLLQDVVNQEKNGQRLTYTSYVAPWQNTLIAGGYYYIFFPGGIAGFNPFTNPTCDEVLEQEQGLVCIADKLAQLADTVGPITYHTVPFMPELRPPFSNSTVNPFDPNNSFSWEIPPPAEVDKFIVRDLAINILAHVALIDSQSVGNGNIAAPCSEGYQDYLNRANASGGAPVSSGNLFTVGLSWPDCQFNGNCTPSPPDYPPAPNGDPTSDVQTTVQERQKFEAGVLRAAGQLLHDLVRESVYSDLAGAAANAAATADQVAGQTLAANIDGNAPYDSLGHVARVLLGRWEGDPVQNGGGEPDPMCQKVAEIDLLPKLADVGTRARAADLGALTKTQALAESLFETSGIVLPNGSLSSGLAGLLTAQLQDIEAVNAPDPTTFASSPQGQAIADLVASLSPSDLARGAQHNRTTFSLLTESTTGPTDNLAAVAMTAGLTLSTDSSVASAGGIAIAGGLLRASVVADPIARTGSMMGGSECSEQSFTLAGTNVPGMSLLLADETSPLALGPPPSTNAPGGGVGVNPPTFNRQDVFAIGQALRGRLVKLREQADGSATTTSASGADAKARAAAVAELGAWAGTGRMVLTTDMGDQQQVVSPGPGGQIFLPTPQSLFLNFQGVDTVADLGAGSPGEIPNLVSLVIDSPTLAECAANLRTTGCAGLNNAIWHPTQMTTLNPLATSSASDLTYNPNDPNNGLPNGPAIRTRYGLTGSHIGLQFPMVGSPNALAFNLLGHTFYVVTSQDPTQPKGVGAVLGALQFSPFCPPGNTCAYGEAAMTLSPMRRELLSAAFGVGKWVGTAPPQAGELPVSGTPTSCVEGFPRDLFVPLQNDLTDNSSSYENSWQHYLNLAQEAATNADNLGQQLVDIGFQRDTVIENAAEQVLQQDGVPPNVDDLSIGPAGNIIPGPSNGAAAAVLNQLTFDVVFFGKDPAPPLLKKDGSKTVDVAGQLAALNTALGCTTGASTSSTGNGPICTKLNASGVVLKDVDPMIIGGLTTASDSQTFAYTALGLAPPPPSGPTPLQCQAAVDTATQMKGSDPVLNLPTGQSPFNASQFAQALGNLDADTIGAAVQQTRMIIDDFPSPTEPQPGHWQVTFDGVPIMDSDNVSLWPACLGASAGCDFAHQPFAAAANSLFRWCTGTRDPKTTPLGGCENNTGESTVGVISQDAELNAIRWRVEGALWLAATMSGGIPAGMFTGPMPAANFPPPNNGNLGTWSAPLNMYFGNGAFTTGTAGTDAGVGEQVVSGFNNQNYGPVNGNEVSALNTINEAAVTVDPTSRYFHWGSTASAQLPLWLTQVYAPALVAGRLQADPSASTYGFSTGDAPGASSNSAPPYVHVFATNEDGPSDFSNLAGFFAQSPLNLSGLSKTQITPGTWANLAALLDGWQCSSPTGFPQTKRRGYTLIGSPGTSWLQGLVASLKTQQTVDSAMRKKYYFKKGSTGLWGAWFGWGEFVPPGCPVPDNCPAVTGFEYMAPPDEGQNAFVFPSAWLDLTPDLYHPSGFGNTGFQPSDLFALSPGSFGSTPSNLTEQDPSVITPSERLRFAFNASAPNGECDAAWQFTQSVALSCLLTIDARNIRPPTGNPPPTLTSISDVVQLSGWLQNQLNSDGQLLQTAFVANAPVAIVANAMGASGVLASSAGTVGKDLAQASNALLQVYTDWVNVQSNAQTIANAIDGARIAIAQADTQQNQQQINLMIQNLQTLKSIADDVNQTVQGTAELVSGSIANSNPMVGGPGSGAGNQIAGAGNIITGFIKMGLDLDIVAQTMQLKDDVNNLHLDAINAAINTLNQSVNVAGTAMTNSFTALRQDINNVGAGNAALATDRSTLAYYLGKATGADVWNCGTGQNPVECISHVNTVLNRRYDGTQLRYDAALKNAKGMAYMARLAIEQRLGIRLSDLSTPVGTLDPPSTWGDDFCHLTGVNYKVLRGEIGADVGTPGQVAATDQAVAAEFADSFIGDYVQKLTDFVAFYNVAYPEQDGNDIAVLSLRESLLGGSASCQGPSTNLLLDSSRLYTTRSVALNATTSGWVTGPCMASDANCLKVRAAPGFQLPAVPGGASWLADVPAVQATVAGAGADAGSDAGTSEAGTSAIPDDVMYQPVLLTTPGSYMLSWWDRALDPSTGQPTSANIPAYNVAVYDSAWIPVTGGPYTPNASVDTTIAGWGDRRTLPPVNIKNAGLYYVVFAASASNAAPGSVAIADVQFEAGASATAYLDTDSAGHASSFACAATPAQMRAAFQRNCDPDGTCHFDLTTPLVINTQTMTSNGMPLAGKLATGNFNFRHIDVAVNVVGTGVLDCSSTGSPDCFGSGFLQYALDDDGGNVGVLGFDGQYRFFDFGTATINHAKAVTAERYITTPVSSADQQLVGQFEAVQFRGRPIDGVYHLKIFDTPALRFDQIQDIQLILNYHYWSRVITSNNSN